MGTVVAYFSIMGLDSDDVWDLFKLLDVDHSGEIDLDEFVGGFMRLRGPAKSIDIARVSYDNKQMRKRLATFMNYMEETVTVIAGKNGINDLKPLKVCRKTVSQRKDQESERP